MAQLTLLRQITCIMYAPSILYTVICSSHTALIQATKLGNYLGVMLLLGARADIHITDINKYFVNNIYNLFTFKSLEGKSNFVQQPIQIL